MARILESAVVVVVLLAPGLALASSCGEVDESRTSALFDGTVVSIEPTPKGAKTVCFDVTSTRQGEPLPRRCVKTRLGGGDCGFEFVVGQTYLVDVGAFGPRGDPTWTNICSRTERLHETTQFGVLSGLALLAFALVVTSTRFLVRRRAP